MRSLIFVAVIAATLAANPADAATLNQRQRNQQQRIAHGITSGRLTPGEVVRLETRALSIARQEARMRASGGGLGPAERHRLHQRLDNLSVAICRQKHDGQRRR